jgi:hypothetical protein
MTIAFTRFRLLGIAPKVTLFLRASFNSGRAPPG